MEIKSLLKPFVGTETYSIYPTKLLAHSHHSNSNKLPSYSTVSE